MVAVIQIAVERLDGGPITKDKLTEINAAMNVCCSEIEASTRLYVRAQLSLDSKVMTDLDIESMGD